MKEITKDIASVTEVSGIRSLAAIYLEGRKNNSIKWLAGILLVAICILFLPWTQNIRTRGYVTTLRQENRPQEINSIIPGRIAKWYVKEGDFVKAGDTIAQLSEIKDSYLDPNLISRTNDQIIAKQSGVSQYRLKSDAIDNQINALQLGLEVKLSQLKLKITSDSMDAVAAENDYNISEAQLARARIMKDSGLIATLQIEQRIQSRQSALAKKISAFNKFRNTKTEVAQVLQEYNEKIFKARSEQASARSDIAAGEAEIAKLNNQAANYTIRNNMYFVLAPQSGQVVKAAKSGVNEIIKEGEKIVEIVPAASSHAVEIFVPAVDLPLLSLGQEVKFQFDGYPAIVFSGWPGASYGIFSGRIVAIENTVNENGLFRVLVTEDRSVKPWPTTLKIGVGASSIALLKNVPVWYELWRNINGFPPDFYEHNKDVKKKKK
jgi:multidrug efflux pump subunit AcrA (membrane-fusion protein)